MRLDDPTAWFDEVDLDPETPWLRMGTRQLGDRPWLAVDRYRDHELALKRELLADRHADVFRAEPGTEAPAGEVVELLGAELGSRGLALPQAAPSVHPLDVAGRGVQDDLCLLRRATEGWILAAASLCFPSRWRLADKIGRPLGVVHGPVAGYAETLDSRVDGLLDRLGERIVWRRNWFVHPDNALFQPDRPTVEPVIDEAGCAAGLFCRSERQTLRRLPDSGWVLFTIRIQQASLGELLADPDRRDRFGRFLAEADADHIAHRGLVPAQVVVLQDALDSGWS